ncbi:MAG: hypothetical protein V3U20_04715 [Thermoplasmata archaeon]
MDTTSSWKISTSTTDKKRRISSKAVFASVFYLIMPTIAITTIIFTYPELSENRLIGILLRIVPVGIVLILVSQFQVRYEKGDKGRFILNEVYVALVVVWLFALLGGESVIHQTWEEYQFSLHIWNYIVLILFVTSINVLYYAMEFQAYRKKDVACDVLNTKEEPIEDDVKHIGVVITTTQVQ